MSVQRRKMNIVSENIANAETTKTADGGPYRRRRLDISADSEKLPFQTILNRSRAGLSRTHPAHLSPPASASRNYESVAVAQGREIVAGQDAYRLVYDPSHPDADEEGYVKMPDIEIINEMVDMMSANRAYEANASAISASKEMVRYALDI